MSARFICSILLAAGLSACAAAEESSHSRRLNNLVSELVDLSKISTPTQSFQFSRANDGWIFISLRSKGEGAVRILVDKELREPTAAVQDSAGLWRREAMSFVIQGKHTIQVECDGAAKLEKIEVRAIPELMHCGLGYNPQIKAFGVYDVDFLKADVLPNITTLHVPGSLQLSDSVIHDWHRQGRHFVGETGVDSQAKTAEEHTKFWGSTLEKTPFLDGIIIDEFIVNNPVTWPLSQERQKRLEQEQQNYLLYGEALKQLRAGQRFTNKMVYAYFGGSGKKLNQEVIGTNFIRNILNCNYRIALERYLHEMSSEKGSQDALQLFIDGISDWEAREPGVKNQMVIAFGLFSMPPGGLNKLPNVDYHVWMDQQMNLAANHPALAGVAGLEWWTSTLADEETVRFVGKLYRHYALEGQTNMFTRDPLFMTHVQNGDFASGTEGWTLHAAEEGAIAVKSFPRYGRIEGRFMGLGRPADPEHIGDTFLWMKRSRKGRNTFSQRIKDLEPDRLYSLEMFSCDYDDLIHPKSKKIEETKSTGTVTIDDVELDTKRSFTEVYASTPEPKIPVGITYYWRVFRAKAPTAQLTVSDWANPEPPDATFGQEQTFNFLEVQPYHE
ncbi:MAG TPA: hypothetical protein VL361_16935 [Candidatus Limnocylindrales bacterium]|nr:hypothetical protein [Candidatus Limnocylindrales bacterium]